MNRQQQEERRQLILNHLATYRLSLRPVIAKLFFEGNLKNCDSVLNNLQRRGWIEKVEGLHGRYIYFRLTESEAKRRGLDKSYYNPKAPNLQEDLAALWFCCIGPIRRYRITPKMQELIYGRAFNGPHCVQAGVVEADDDEQDVKGKPPREKVLKHQVYWMYVGSSAQLSTIIKKLAEHLEEVDQCEEARGAPLSPRDLLADRQYRAVVLVNTEAKRKELKSKLIEQKPLIYHLAHVQVEVAPSPSTLKEAFNALPCPAGSAASPKRQARKRSTDRETST